MIRNIYHRIKRNEIRNKILKKYNHQTISISEVINSEDISNSYSLFITNDRSGGTRDYENNMSLNMNLIILRRIGYYDDNDRFFNLENSSNNKHIILSINEVVQVFNYSFERIIVSSLVDYSDIEWILSLISNYRQENNKTSLIYLVHDFFCISPSCNLFINGKFCDPCSEEYPNEFFYKNSHYSSEKWKSIWFNFLNLCDEIRCFSNSSRNLVSRYYNNLNYSKISVIPHDMTYCKNHPINNIDSLPFSIGVVGACHADFKGRDIVSEMIRKYGNNVSITLIGSSWWRFRICRKRTKYLGPYKRDELQHIIENNKVSCILFPSLCPETFSYVISELMLLDIPILCFNIGAQAEKISQYKKGTILFSTDDLWNYIERNKK